MRIKNLSAHQSLAVAISATDCWPMADAETPGYKDGSGTGSSRRNESHGACEDTRRLGLSLDGSAVKDTFEAAPAFSDGQACNRPGPTLDYNPYQQTCLDQHGTGEGLLLAIATASIRFEGSRTAACS